jgi:hypothetical protein
MSFEHDVQRHGQWRGVMAQRLSRSERLMREHGLLTDEVEQRMLGLQRLLVDQRLVIALTGPHASGRAQIVQTLLSSTHVPLAGKACPEPLCSLEIAADVNDQPVLLLLPIETRQSPWSVNRWLQERQAWRQVPVSSTFQQALADAWGAVAETRRVHSEEAQVLGLSQSLTSPAVGALLLGAGMQVPRWRSARLQVPHPLLQQGVVVRDVPAMNDDGSHIGFADVLLSDADVVLFVMAADTGMTRSDLAHWRRCVAASAKAKSQLLAIELANAPDDASAGLRGPFTPLSQVLGLAPIRLRVSGPSACDADTPSTKVDSLHGFSEVDRTLSQMAQVRHDTLLGHVRKEVSALFQEAGRIVQVHQRGLIDHLLELQALDGKNTRMLQQMRWRAGQEQARLDVSMARLLQAKDRQQAQLRDLFGQLGPVRLRSVMQELMAALSDVGVRLDMKTVYHRAFDQLMGDVDMADTALQAMHRTGQELAATFEDESGAELCVVPVPDLQTFRQQLRQIEASHAQYLGWSAFVQRLKNGFGVRVGQTLMSRLQSLFDTLLGDIEQWHKQSLDALEAKGKDVRHRYSRRFEALTKVQEAATQLEQQIAELRQQNSRLDALNDELLQLYRQCVPVPDADAVAQQEPVHG